MKRSPPPSKRSPHKEKRPPEPAKRPTHITDLKPWERNTRAITPKALEGLKVSLDAFGDLSGIVYNTRNQALVTGHQRLQAIRERYGNQATIAGGAILLPTGETIPIRYVDWDDDTHAAANLAANNPNIEGTFTSDTLALLQAVEKSKPVLFNTLELSTLTRQIGGGRDAKDLISNASGEAGGKVRTKSGDLYELGTHRVLCGDATSWEDVAVLTNGDKVQLVHTDPPYGVSYESAGAETMRGDNKREQELLALLVPAFKNMVRAARDDAAFYIWHASATRREFDKALQMAGLEEKQYIIWSKASFVMGRADYQWQHEPCFYAQKLGSRAAFFGGRDQATVWDVAITNGSNLAVTMTKGLKLIAPDGHILYLTSKSPKANKAPAYYLVPDAGFHIAMGDKATDLWMVTHTKSKYDHPTQKPSELAARAIRNSSKPKDTVLDLFAGSGSTMLAAEATNRRAFLMEIDPKYVDVIVTNYVRAAGTDAIIKNGKELTWK